MTDQAGHNLQMPDRSERVRETIRRFESTSERPSALLSMSDPDLFEAGLLLSDRSLSIADAHRKVNEMLGGTKDEPVVARSSFYRFADRFKALLGQVSAEYARRLVRLRVEDATDDNIRDMTRLSRNLLVELAAEQLVGADSIEDVEKTLTKLAAIVNDAEHVQLKADKLELDRQQYERQMRETIAKLELAEQRSKQLQLDIEAAERKHRQSIESAKQATTTKASTSGGKLTEEDVLSILDRAMKGEL
ncbi:MAG: hypothetical protein AAF085_08310 [Planctomycetota bacterium]